MDFLGGLNAAVGIGSGIAGLFGGNKKTGAEKEMEDALDMANDSAEKMWLAESDPWFNKQVGVQQQRLKGNFIEGLRQALINNQRGIARGAPGTFVNPDRRDESIVSALASGVAAAKDKARQEVLGRLTTVGEISRGVAGAGGALGQLQANRMQNAGIQQDAGIRSIVDSLGTLFGGGGGNNISWGNYAPGWSSNGFYGPQIS
jgi:hypothetical protein